MADQRILFAKYGTAKYISHLDLMHTMERAFLRAGITIRHTAGFHPHPYVSIPLPLPLFFSSQCELLEFGLVEGSTMEQLPEQMNKVLPEGIEILDCYEGGLPFRSPERRRIIPGTGQPGIVRGAEKKQEIQKRIYRSRLDPSD